MTGHHDAQSPERESRDHIAAEMRGPAIARWLERFPELREATHEALDRARRVRLAASRALPTGEAAPLPPDTGLVRAETDLRGTVDVVVGLADRHRERRGGDAATALRRLAAALLAVRIEGQAFSPARSTSSPAARRELFAALASFTQAYEELERLVRAHHAQRIPWQIELATHVSPTTPGRELEIEGFALPLVPASRRPWGERCTLSGRPFHTDSRRAPGIRFRSLDCWHHVLAPEVHGMLVRLGQALERLRTTAPEAVRDLARLCPFLFEDYAEELGNPTFVRLGLLDYPALAVTLNNLLLAHGDRPFLGRRSDRGGFADLGCADREDRAVPGSVGSRTGYVWDTFAAARDASLRLAHALESHGLRPGDRLGILTAENAPEFYVADFAAVFSHLVSIGVGAGLGAERLAQLAHDTEMRAIVSDAASARLLAATGPLGWGARLSALLVFGAAGAPLPIVPGVSVLRLEEILAAAATPPREWRSASGVTWSTPVIYDDVEGAELARSNGIVPDRDDAVYAVVFSSGTTGAPKGTVVTRRRWAEEMFLEANVWPHVAVSFLPSSLMADRASVWRALNNGGRIGFVRGGAALFRDLRAVRPTLLDAPPVVWSSLLAPYKAMCSAGAGRSERAAGRASARKRLGGRLAWAAIGGAPSEAGLRRDLAELLGVAVIDGYGTTETGQIAADGRLLANVDVRLVDVPELGLAASAEPRRGELAVRTERSSGRYLGDDSGSPARFTEDGYFLTGDLVELGADGSCRVIGRRQHAFKLAGGEFVSPEELENRYLASEMVEAVFITGLGGERAVVAVVVPDRPDRSEAEVRASLRKIAARDGLRPCEVPVGVIVEPRRGGESPWTPENGLLTASLKPSRRALEARYRQEISALYERARQVRSAGPALSGETGLGEATRVVVELAAAALSCAPGDLDPARSFTELGGDSISALDFALRLEALGLGEDSGEDPSGLVRRPLADLAGLIAERGTRAGSEDAAPPVPLRPAVDGTGPPPTPGIVEMANADAREPPRRRLEHSYAEAADVLLTGATGFLGVHLLTALYGLLPPGARLCAAVRAGSHEEARDRLCSSLARASLPVPAVGLPGRMNGARLVALACSLERERLGLDAEGWDWLTTGIGLIVHAAAEVRPGSDYSGLRGSNVIATRQLLELATTGALKAFHFVSSLNVTLLVEDLLGGRARERSPLPPWLPSEVGARHPAYAITKWVSERLVLAVLEAIGGGFSASVSRPALLTWSSRTGHANPSDWLTRVLESCLALRAAIGDAEAGVPSFAAVTETSARGLDMVPVDFAAQAIARLALRTWTGTLPAAVESEPGNPVPTFHVSNLNPGERGLVTRRRLMDLLALADLPFASPGQALRFLPVSDWALEVERAGASALPVLGALEGSGPLRPRTSARDFAQAIGHGRDDGIVCPPVDLSYLTRFVRHFYEASRS